MKRYGLRASLGAGLLVLGGAAALIAAPLLVIDPSGGAGQPGSRGESQPAAQGAEPVRPGNPLWAIPIKELTVTRERPIFSPSRRPPPPVITAAPYVPPPPPMQPAGPQRPELALVGTVVNTKEGFGIFLDQATNSIVRLKTGEAHNGWILRSVQGREATLQKDRETAVLALPPHDAEQTGIPAAIIPPTPGPPAIIPSTPRPPPRRPPVAR
jgi:hypothetical protein